MEYSMEQNGILMRISNTPLSLLLCKVMTKNVEVVIHRSEMSCERIHDNNTRGTVGNLGKSAQK